MQYLLNRHTGELLEQIGVDQSQIVFTPHRCRSPVEFSSTIYVRSRAANAGCRGQRCITIFFAASPMVRIYDKVCRRFQYSVHTNYADIGFHIAPDGRRAIVVSCLDNC